MADSKPYRPPFDTARRWGLLSGPRFRGISFSPSQAILNALGLTAGAAMTRSLPRMTPDGRVVFTSPEGSDTPPVTLGDVQILPRETTARTRAHENLHTQQSRELGPLYPVMSLLGGEFGPLEEEAYARTANVQTSPDDAASDKFMREEIARRRSTQSPALKFLLGLGGGSR